jgi:hypothetical protein
LTEASDTSWEELQPKMRLVECIELWHGTVSVSRIQPDNMTGTIDLLNQWGANGCLIGDFLLFGDSQLLERIQGAFRRLPGRFHDFPFLGH